MRKRDIEKDIYVSIIERERDKERQTDRLID